MNQIPYIEELVTQIERFVTDGITPNLSRSLSYRFKSRYSGPEWTVKDDQLFYDGKKVARERLPELLERLLTTSLRASYRSKGSITGSA